MHDEGNSRNGWMGLMVGMDRWVMARMDRWMDGWIDGGNGKDRWIDLMVGMDGWRMGLN